jgi:hypothetical protein
MIGLTQFFEFEAPHFAVSGALPGNPSERGVE